MSGYIKFNWLVEKRLVFAELVGEPPDDDIEALVIKPFDAIMLDYLAQSTPLMHYIGDISQFKISLRQSGIIKAMSDVSYAKRVDFGWTVAIGNNHPIIRMTLNLTSQITKTRLREFDNIPEALAFLNYVDTTLPDLQVSYQQLKNSRTWKQLDF